MDLEAYLEHLNSGEPVTGGSEAHLFMHGVSQEALRITAEINGSYHEPKQLRALFSQLIGQPVDESFALFPPFHTDCGKNIHIGKRVFINMGCKFQDQGGIFIGDGALIGHNVVLATLNHAMSPNHRGTMIPAPDSYRQECLDWIQCHRFARCYHWGWRDCGGRGCGDPGRSGKYNCRRRARQSDAAFT